MTTSNEARVRVHANATFRFLKTAVAIEAFAPNGQRFVLAISGASGRAFHKMIGARMAAIAAANAERPNPDPQASVEVIVQGHWDRNAKPRPGKPALTLWVDTWADADKPLAAPHPADAEMPENTTA